MTAIESSTPVRISAVLVSVGGTAAPVLYVLKEKRSPHVWYFCSAESRPKADEIQQQLDWHPQARFIEVERFEELGPCYTELRRRIPDILKETRVQPAEVLVDYTGGTKTMSAALVLLSSELFQQFSYVGGEQREKGGLGIAVDGKARVLYQNNPWNALAVREVERVRDLWAACQFDGAAELLKGVASKVSLTRRFEALALLAETQAARHRLDFPTAESLSRNALGRLRPIYEGRRDNLPMTLARHTQEIVADCAKGTASEVFLRELLDNALRTAAQRRYEDAAARLYRVMEMQGQLWLAETTNGLFENGRCRIDDQSALPLNLQCLVFCQPDQEGEIKLSQEQCFRALAACGHERATLIVTDLDAKKPTGETISRWRDATQNRNNSILAHGVQSIGKKGFDNMKRIASDFLGLDLEKETNPIPPFDPLWLE